MPTASRATQFGPLDFSFTYEATPEQMTMLAEEALANGIKSQICARILKKRAAIDDRATVTVTDIQERFPTVVRGVAVGLLDISKHVAAIVDPMKAVRSLAAAMKSGSLTAEQKAELLALLG